MKTDNVGIEVSKSTVVQCKVGRLRLTTTIGGANADLSMTHEEANDAINVESLTAEDAAQLSSYFSTIARELGYKAQR